MDARHVGDQHRQPGGRRDLRSADATFDGTGNRVTPSDGLINVEIGDSVGPQSLTIDIKKLTQFADGNKLSLENLDQDGYQVGCLLNTYSNSHGMLIGSYSNGELRNLFKLPSPPSPPMATSKPNRAAPLSSAPKLAR